MSSSSRQLTDCRRRRRLRSRPREAPLRGRPSNRGRPRSVASRSEPGPARSRHDDPLGSYVRVSPVGHAQGHESLTEECRFHGMSRGVGVDENGKSALWGSEARSSVLTRSPLARQGRSDEQRRGRDERRGRIRLRRNRRPDRSGDVPRAERKRAPEGGVRRLQQRLGSGLGARDDRGRRAGQRRELGLAGSSSPENARRPTATVTCTGFRARAKAATASRPSPTRLAPGAGAPALNTIDVGPAE